MSASTPLPCARRRTCPTPVTSQLGVARVTLRPCRHGVTYTVAVSSPVPGSGHTAVTPGVRLCSGGAPPPSGTRGHSITPPFRSHRPCESGLQGLVPGDVSLRWALCPGPHAAPVSRGAGPGPAVPALGPRLPLQLGPGSPSARLVCAAPAPGSPSCAPAQLDLLLSP